MHTRNLFVIGAMALSLSIATSCSSSSTDSKSSAETVADSVSKPVVPTRIVRAGEADGNRFFTDESGQKLFGGATFFNAFEFSQGYAIVTKKEGEQELYGVINAKGETVIPITHVEKIREYDHGYFKIFDGKYGYLDSTGKVVIPMEYTSEKGISEGLFILEKGYGKWGLVNAKGEVVVPFEYSKIDYFNEGLAVVEKGGKRGAIDATGKLVIPATYASLTGFSQGVCLAQKGSKYGLIDKENKPIGEFAYDEFKWEVESVKSEVSETGYAQIGQQFITKDGYIVVAKGKMWGAINPKGEIVIPFDFDYVGGKDAMGVNVGLGKKRGVWKLDEKAVKWFGE